MWITCGQLDHRARGHLKLPNSLEEYQFSGIFVSGSVRAPGRDPVNASRRMADFRHLISCWLKVERLVFWTNLNLQVEREGNMDWITLLIPVKIAVICVVLWVAYKYYIGVWSSEAPGRSSSWRRWAAAAGPARASSQFPPFRLSTRLLGCGSTSDSIDVIIRT